MTVRILHGDCIEQLRTLADESVHSIVTDPPYGLEFMGKEWDAPWKKTSGGFSSPGIGNRETAWPSFKGSNRSRCADCRLLIGQGGSPCRCDKPRPVLQDADRMRTFQVWCEQWARECLRVLKPGGHLLSFGGSRTYHRMACAIEDAGFEIRDQIQWVYASGFPKSLNLDNLRGDKTCDCESQTERNLRSVRNADVSTALDSGEGRGEVLQYGVPEQSPQGAMLWPESSEGTEALGESGLERWRNSIQEEGQLRERPLCASTGLGEADGAQRRLLDAAPTSDGGMVRLSTGASRDGASPQPSTDREPANESGTVAGQPQPQARGAWPLCDRCGKPMVTKGLGTALKPAHEPIVVARKPLIGTVAANVLAHGTGALNIDSCRVGTEAIQSSGSTGMDARRFAHGTRPSDYGASIEPSEHLGRWPANLILSYPEDEYEVRGDLSADQKRELYGWLGANA